MNKKLLAILLAAVMMLALAACGDEPATAVIFNLAQPGFVGCMRNSP